MTGAEDIYPSRNTSMARWLPRRDPVVYGSLSDHSPISAQQVAAFERDGFVALGGVFDNSEMAALQDELQRLRAAPESAAAETLIAEPQSGALRSIFAIHRQSPLFERLAGDARLVNIARHILGDDVYIHQSRLNYKPGFAGRDFFWHSDFETWHAEDGMPRMRALSVSLLLSDNYSVNGPLMLIPGSHKTFVACVGETPDDHYKQSLRKQEFGVPDHGSLEKLANDGGIVAPVGAPGTVILFDCNTMHGSNGNITPYPRSNAFIVYNAMSNRLAAPFAGPAPRPEFVATRATVEALLPIRGQLMQADQEAA